jgi:hypothetical protein
MIFFSGEVAAKRGFQVKAIIDQGGFEALLALKSGR